MAERRLSFKDGSFHAKVGERLEAEEDYAEHYKALAETATHFQASVVQAGQPVTAEHTSQRNMRNVFKEHPFALPLKQFEDRRDKGTLKRRADVEENLMRASAANMDWQLDRGLAIDASAAVSDATVNNDTNIFYSNFYPDMSCAFMSR